MRKSWVKSLRNLTVFVLAIVMVFALGACNEKGDGGDDTPPDTPPAVSVSAPTIDTFTIEADTGATYGELNNAHKLAWTITGDCTEQTLTVTRNGSDAVSGTDYDYVEQSKKITFKTAGAYKITLKAVNDTKSVTKSISITINDAAATLVFGNDPFGGTWTDLKPNVGMALYFDATNNGTPLTYDDVTYTIAGGTTAAGAQIVNSGVYATRPYVIATGEGTVKVKIEATDGTDTIDFTKDFTVAHGSDSYDTYFKTVYPESGYMFDGASVWVDGWNPDENVAASKYVATKNGVILAPDTSELHVESFVGIATAYTNYTVTFDFTVLACGADTNNYGDVYFYARNESDTEVGGLGATFSTGEKIANSFNTYAAGNALALTNVVSHHTELNAPAIGETVKLQIVKSGLEGAVKISYDDGDTYSDIITGTFNNDAAGKMKNIYIWARGYVNYAIENLTVVGDNNAVAIAPTIDAFTIAADTDATYGELNNAHKLAWTITGECTDQTLTVKKDGQTAVSGTDYDYVETTKTITFKTVGAYTLTLEAVNGTKSATKTISITIAEKAQTLVFGNDPFGGTWTELKPNVGMVLYFDATNNGTQLTYADVTYTIVTDGTTAAGAQIVNAYENRPYVIATGEGNINVKIEATDGTDTIEDTKIFTVGHASDSYDAYFKTVYKGTNNVFSTADSGIWVDGWNPTESVAASKYVATKNGVILAPDTSKNHVESFVGVTTAYTNYTVTFDFTVLAYGAGTTNNYGDLYFYARNASDVEVGGLGATFNPGDKIVNSFNTYAAGDSKALTNVVSNHTQLNTPAIGQTVKMQIVKNGLNCAVKISYDNGATYSDIITGTFNNDAAGKMSNIFIWARGYINYAIENITVTGT